MKSIFFTLFAGLFCTQAMAYELTPYMGFNAQIRHFAFKKNYGEGVFESNIPQGEIIAGLKINPHFGLELGYLRSMERHKKSTIYYPEQLFGNTITDGYVRGTSSTRIDGYSVNLLGFFPVRENIQLLGSVGIARLRIKLCYMPLAIQSATFGPDLVQEFTKDFLKSKYIPQVKMGVQYMLTQTVGLKALAGWEGTKRFNLLRNKQGSPARVSLKDSYTLGLGLAWYFN